jgi:hypothetical protein
LVGLQHLGVNEKITLERTSEKGGGKMWIRFNWQDRFQRYAVIGIAMYVQVPSDMEKFFTSWAIIKF